MLKPGSERSRLRGLSWIMISLLASLIILFGVAFSSLIESRHREAAPGEVERILGTIRGNAFWFTLPAER